MSKEERFAIIRCPVYRRAKALRQLSFLHHSTFGVRYSAVLFRVYAVRQVCLVALKDAAGLSGGVSRSVLQTPPYAQDLRPRRRGSIGRRPPRGRLSPRYDSVSADLRVKADLWTRPEWFVSGTPV